MAWRGYSQASLAQALDLSHGAIQGWQRGSEPLLATMNRLADALGVSRWWLLTGAPSSPPARCPACGRRL